MSNFMSNGRCLFLFVATLLVSFVASPLYSQQAEQQPGMRAHRASLFRAPSRWDHALMTGNGSLGAIVMTQLPNETITLCHDQLMLRSQKPNLPDLSHILPAVRKLIAQRKYRDAKGLFEGTINETYDYRGPDAFHPAMDITVDQQGVDAATATVLRRTLDHETGEVTTAWTQGDVRYERKLFVSRNDNVVVMQISASKPGSITAKIGLLPTALKREELGGGKNVRVPRFTKEYKAKVILPEVPITFNLAAEGDELLTLLAECDTGGPHKMIGGEYGTAAHVYTKGGTKKVENLLLCVDKADEVVLVEGMFTNEPSATALPELRRRVAALPKDYDTLLKRHTDIHRELFLRCTVDLDADPQYRAMTNEALFHAVRGEEGYKAMLERLYDAGRFVLMAELERDQQPDASESSLGRNLRTRLGGRLPQRRKRADELLAGVAGQHAGSDAGLLPILRLDGARLPNRREALIALVRNGLFRPSMGTQVGQGNRWPVIQFDATMACPSAVLEMLFYSDPTLLRILPALPDMLPTGRAGGMLIRGGGTADIDWDIPNRRVVARITSPTERTVDIRFPARLHEITADGATLAASDYGDVYRKVTLPAAKTVTFTVRLTE